MSDQSPGEESRAERMFRALDRVLLAISNIALVVILLTICWSVVSRYVLRTPVSWAEDVTTIAFAWMIFIAMAAVHDRRGHISVDMLATLFPVAYQRLHAKLVELIVVLFCACTAFLCGQQMVISHTTAHTTALRIPLSVFFASLTIGFALMAIRSLGYLFGVRPIPAEIQP